MRSSTKNLEYVDTSTTKADMLRYQRHPTEKNLEKAAHIANLMNYYDEMMWASLGNSHLSYIVHGDIYLDFANSPEMGRLNGIGQLGIIRYNPLFVAHHTRFDHSLLTAVIAEVVLTNNNRSEDEIKLGTASGYSHDIAVPAYSEYGKLANREQLNEEDNITLVIGKLANKLKKYGISQDDVVRCVRGQYPVIGKLINSDGVDIDKISYTGLDATKVFLYRDMREMKSIFDKDPFLFDIYEDIKIVGENIVFANPERVSLFLKARALMFRDVYYTKENRAREAFFKKTLRNMWDKGILNRDLLISLNDHGFETLLVSNDPLNLSSKFMSSYPPFKEVARFNGIPVEDVRRRFGDEYVVEEWNSFNPSTNTLVMSNGQIRNFRDLYPEVVKELEELSRSCKYVGVYEMETTTPDERFLKHLISLE